mgnify:CR=1 FL=1
MFEDHGVKVHRRPEEPALHRRHRARLRARGPERGLQVQQSAREGPLRLRRVVPGLEAASARRFAEIMAGPLRGPFSFDMNSSLVDDFALFGLPRRFALDRARARRAPARAAGRGSSRPLRRPAAPRRSGRRCSGRCASTRPTQRLEGSAQARRVSVRARRRADPRRGQHRDAARVPDAADGVARGARRAPRSRDDVEALAARGRRHAGARAYGELARALDERRRLRGAPRGRCRALMFVERFAADVDRPARGAWRH